MADHINELDQDATFEARKLRVEVMLRKRKAAGATRASPLPGISPRIRLCSRRTRNMQAIPLAGAGFMYNQRLNSLWSGLYICPLDGPRNSRPAAPASSFLRSILAQKSYSPPQNQPLLVPAAGRYDFPNPQYQSSLPQSDQISPTSSDLSIPVASFPRWEHRLLFSVSPDGDRAWGEYFRQYIGQRIHLLPRTCLENLCADRDYYTTQVELWS